MGSKKMESTALDLLPVVLISEEGFPDKDVNEEFIRRLLREFPERYKDLLGNGKKPLSEVLEVFYDGDVYNIWREVINKKNPGDTYLGVDVLPEEIPAIRALLESEVVKADISNMPAATSKTKKNSGPLL